MSWVGRFVLGAAAAIVLVAGGARAGEPGETEKARLAAFLRSGADAARGRKWDACIQAYSSAAAIEDAPVTSGELGLCEEQAGRYADAYRHLQRATEAAPPEPKGAKAEQHKRYEAAKARVRKRVAILFVSVSPTHAEVVLDGRPIGPVDGRHIAVDPGTHTVTARLAGYEDAIDPPRTWSAGDVPHVHLELKPKAAPAQPVSGPPNVSANARHVSVSPVPGPAPAPSPWYVPAANARGVLVVLGYATLATAIASAATSIGLEADRLSLRGQLTPGACGPDAPSRPALCDPLAERITQRDTAFGVAVGAHVATGLLAGAARLAFGFERDSNRPAVAPAAGTSGGGIVVLGTW